MKKRIKVLPKSQRDAKRYFFLDCNFLDLKKIKENFIFLFGALKFSESGFVMRTVDKKNLIKINRNFVNELIFCIFYTKKLGAKIKVIKQSGTLNSL